MGEVQAKDTAELRLLEDRFKIRGSDRIQINNLLCAVSITILAVILSLSRLGVSEWIIIQLAITIPCLVTSSLAYAKMAYRPDEEYHLWDNLGWATHSLGYILILNALIIMLHRQYPAAAWILIGVTVSLFVLYSGLDVLAKRKRLKEKAAKLSFYLLLMFIGAILPILLG